MILHVIDSLAPGGAERVLVELVNALHRRHVPVGICVTRAAVDLRREVLGGIPVLVLERRHTWDRRALRRFLAYCRAEHVTILHAHGRGSMRLCALAKVLLVGAGHSVRVVFHDHFGSIDIDQSVPSHLWLPVHFVVDQYIGVSPSLVRWARERLRLPESKTMLLGNAIDLGRFEGAVPIPRSELTQSSLPLLGIHIANFRRQKDHGLLIRALAGSNAARERLHILLLGLEGDPPYKRECQALIEELGLQRNFTLLGPRVDVPQLLAASDLGVLSSRSESGPIALLEYLAAGLPFVVTRTGQIAELVYMEGEFPGFVAAGDEAGFTAALDAMVELSADERRRLGDAGRRLVARLFDIRRQAEELATVYERLERGAGGLSP
ncbi:MAG: hypothetical protein JWO05_1316 [Gemmatimonadetes bacterium]|nr:hypothetical protein [Gemmatimonadota bacterium]